MEFLGNLFDKIYNYSSSFFYGMGMFVSFLIIVCTFVYRIYLAKSVALVLGAKKIENVKTWKILAFIFGLIPVVICFFINLNVGEKINNEKVKKLIKKYIINAVVFGLLFLIFQPFQDAYLIKQNLYYNRTTMEIFHKTFYDDELKQYVCYDKKGNVYSYDDKYDNIKLYDKDGYAYEHDNEDDYNYYSYDAKKKVMYSSAYIDENGYFVAKDNLNDYMYYDEEYMDTYCLFSYDGDKNIYFPPDYCSWDKNGNLIFKNEDIQGFDFNSFK